MIRVPGPRRPDRMRSLSLVGDPLAGDSGPQGVVPVGHSSHSCKSSRSGEACGCRSKALPLGYDTSSTAIPHVTEVDPALTFAGALARRRFAEYPQAAPGSRRPAASRSSTYKAMWWRPHRCWRGAGALVGRFVLEDLEECLTAERKKCSRRITARSSTPRCSLIQ